MTSLSGSAKHLVLVSAVGEQEALVSLEGFDDTGAVATTELTVEAGTTRGIDVAKTMGSPTLSVMIEADAPVVVEHRFSTERGADQAPCTTFSADTWYFPTVVTTRDATARLSLFNPFPGDASVDIEVAIDAGVRQPPGLSGLVVRAGSTLVVELGEHVERRDQFSVTVTTRSGGVVAELAQSFDGSGEVPVTGLRLVPGTRTAVTRWSFAGGFTDPTAPERVVAFNPNDEPVDVLVQVLPYGGTDVLPEPFEITVAARRYGVVDLDQESRVPPVGDHAIEVESRDGAPVVAARSMSITGPGSAEGQALRSLLSAGTTASPGGSAAARRWVSPSMALSDALDGAIMVHNPGATTVSGTVTAIAADGTEAPPVRFEIPAGDSISVSAEDMFATQVDESGTSFSAFVVADSDVVVERLMVFVELDDLSLQSSIPVLGSLDDLGLIGG